MNRRTRSLVIGTWAMLAMLSAGSGCAYFNTLYNARQKYDDALDIKRKADPERDKITQQEEKLYGDAFDRAARVVKYWPTSRWVDDALLLMGKSSYEKGDYSTALRKFNEILTIFPNSELADQARLEKGRTLIATKDYAEAVSELNRVAEHGGDKYRPDVLYHLGVVRDEEGDVDGALEAYGEVTRRYPKSQWLAPAGLAAGDLERERGRRGEAVGYYERVRRRGRTAEERSLGGIRKGEALRDLGELPRARNTFHDVAKNAVNEERRGKALLAEAAAVAATGDTTGAVRAYDAILAAYPRKEAAAEAQFAKAKMKDDVGDLAGARADYELVKEQGTGHEAWQRATERITEIQQVLDLREEVASEGPDRDRSRFLLAEQLLEKIGDIDGALAQYDTLAVQAKGSEWGAKALFAKAWVLENRRSQPAAADSALFKLANFYAGTEVDAFARRRLGYPVWKVEKIEPPKVVYIRSASDANAVASSESMLDRIEPKPVPLPPDKPEVKVWVRVGLARDGSVEETRVVKSGGEDFDQACLEAARASRFLSPDEGGPVLTVVQYVFPLPSPTPVPSGAPSAAADSTNAPPDRNAPAGAVGLSGAADSTNFTPVPPDSGAAAGDFVPAGEPDSTTQPPPPPGETPLPSIRDRRLDRKP